MRFLMSVYFICTSLTAFAEGGNQGVKSENLYTRLAALFNEAGAAKLSEVKCSEEKSCFWSGEMVRADSANRANPYFVEFRTGKSDITFSDVKPSRELLFDEGEKENVTQLIKDGVWLPLFASELYGSLVHRRLQNDVTPGERIEFRIKHIKHQKNMLLYRRIREDSQLNSNGNADYIGYAYRMVK